MLWITDQLKLDKTLADSEIYPNEVENIENLLSEAKLVSGVRPERFSW